MQQVRRLSGLDWVLLCRVVEGEWRPWYTLLPYRFNRLLCIVLLYSEISGERCYARHHQKEPIRCHRSPRILRKRMSGRCTSTQRNLYKQICRSEHGSMTGGRTCHMSRGHTRDCQVRFRCECQISFRCEGYSSYSSTRAIQRWARTLLFPDSHVLRVTRSF